MTLIVGGVLENRYRIDGLLGQGGMGAVYRAYDIRLQQAVAIKENTVAALGISPEAIAAARKQFEREALVLARLRHPSLPRVIDHFVSRDGNQYLVMDCIEGGDLAQIIAHTGALPESQAVTLVSQVCSALEYLHSQQPPIIHRDIKPQNIKVTPKGQVFLVDFGIAKVGEASKTTTGALGITPGFSPPEQYGLGSTDARSDVYALGATLYVLLTGQTPPESITLLSGEAKLAPPHLVNTGVTQGVQQAVLKAMEPRRTDRPQSVAEFRRMLISAKAIEPSLVPRSLSPTRLADKVEPAESSPAPAKSIMQPKPELSTPAMSHSRSTSVPITKPKPRVRSSARTKRNLLVFLMVGGGMLIVLATLSIAVFSVSMMATPTWPATPLLSASRTPVPPTMRPTSTLVPTLMPAFEPVTIATRVAEKDSMTMVYVPAGEFLMGSSDSDRDAAGDEKPQHLVYLDAFWIDQTEVTNAQYKQCVQDRKCNASEYANNSKYNDDTQPVVGVGWDDAKAYCEWVGRQLPTEAQWEKAARGTDGRIYPWSDQKATCEYAVMNDGSGNGCSKGAAWAVGSKHQGASPYGALDMAGNVWEWVTDWYDRDYYSSSPARNPQGPSAGEFRVLRGGSWLSDYSSDRAAYCSSNMPTLRSYFVGFRCVVVLP